MNQKSKSLKAGLYARVSTADQTTENQLRDLRKYAADRGWEIYDEYVDRGLRILKEALLALHVEAESVLIHSDLRQGYGGR